ncbi:MAG: hypothetical protein RLZZ536_1902, partial [Planctomycetota bacterium]
MFVEYRRVRVLVLLDAADSAGVCFVLFGNSGYR